VSDTLAIVATTAGVIMAASPVLQIRRMLVTRSSEDLSLAYMGVLLFGFVAWISYGISLGNYALIISNTVALVVTVTTIAVALRLRSAGD
jgi:uncharacterized protein with PQ loop repeat